MSHAKERSSVTELLIRVTLLRVDLFPERTIKFSGSHSGNPPHGEQGQAPYRTFPDLSKQRLQGWLCPSFSWRTTFSSPHMTNTRIREVLLLFKEGRDLPEEHHDTGLPECSGYALCGEKMIRIIPDLGQLRGFPLRKTEEHNSCAKKMFSWPNFSL